MCYNFKRNYDSYLCRTLENTLYCTNITYTRFSSKKIFKYSCNICNPKLENWIIGLLGQFWSHTFTFHFCFRHLKNATLAWMMILIHDWWPSIITEAFQLSYLWPQNGLGRRTCQHISRASKTWLQESTSQNGCDTDKGWYFNQYDRLVVIL